MIKIYQYTNLITNKPCYVGKTKRTLKQRAGRNGRYYGPCSYFWSEIQKYGWENFQGEVLTETDDEEYASLLEWFYTIELNTLYPNGCNNYAGSRQSKEAKEKRSEVMKDRVVSLETRQKLSQSLRNRVPWNKDRKCSNLSLSLKGHVTKSETKAKIAETLKSKEQHWFTDGVHNVLSTTCPEGFHPGLTRKRKKITN